MPPGPRRGSTASSELLEQLRSAGLAVELSVEGEARTLDPGLEVSAYRIVQEALTNSLKHARGGRARVQVRYLADALEITVEDERGPASPTAVEPPHEGRGLIGMRERAAMLRRDLPRPPDGGRLPREGATPDRWRGVSGMTIRVCSSMTSSWSGPASA